MYSGPALDTVASFIVGMSVLSVFHTLRTVLNSKFPSPDWLTLKAVNQSSLCWRYANSGKL